VKLLVVDDHPLVREGISSILSANEDITEDEKENENLDIVTDTKEDMGEVKSE